MQYKNSTMFILIDEYIHVAQDRRIMKDRLLNGYSIDMLAGKYKMSPTNIQRKVQEYKKMLEERLEME